MGLTVFLLEAAAEDLFELALSHGFFIFDLLLALLDQRVFVQIPLLVSLFLNVGLSIILG
jgi:hypothetical protein